MKKYKEVAPALINTYRQYCNLLIVTATKVEKDVLHKHLLPIDGEQKIIRIQKGNYTYYLGKLGHYNAVHVATGNMGAISRSASIATTMKAIEYWRPKAALMVGIAFGSDPKKVAIGDVLIAERVVNYQLVRVNKSGSRTYRGPEGPAGSLLVNRLTSVEDWNFMVEYGNVKYQAKKVHGLMLSGEELVDNKARKGALMKQWPSAIGGEMEGAGIYSACEVNSVHEWILVKGVCDYGDGNKDNDPNKELFQEIAIRSAVSLVEKTFSSPYAFEDIGLYSGALPSAQVDAEGSKKKVNKALNEQVIRQLEKQKASHKYIPETFVEVGKNKELLRYFCDPIGFLPKVMAEYAALDFAPLNAMLTKHGVQKFQFDLKEFEDSVPKVTLENLHDFYDKLDSLLKLKINELENPPVPKNAIRDFAYKVSRLESASNWLVKKVCLIKEHAGQGKTNFICDLTENYLLKREIPAVFLLGTNVEPADIRKSLMKRVYPDRSDLNFEDFLSEIEQYCKSVDRPFVIIIDGLNENSAAQKLSVELENFIAEITMGSFVRIIVTCRSEYYQKHFSNFDGASFSALMGETSHLNISRNNIAAKKIFFGYLEHFNIDIKTYSTATFDQLTRNFLLLRIFCDAHSGESIPHLGTIHKEALFKRYYQTKVAEITKRMNEDDELTVMGPINISKFIGRLISHMVKQRKYENIPLDELIENEDNRKVYVRFLDENILVRRDPNGVNEVFGDQEVVNFTFDEFRDYLIADYLVSKVYPTEKDEFVRFLTTEISPTSRILEGCGTFLYFISKKSGNGDLLAIVEGQSWFVDVYLRCIFNLEDKFITSADRDRIFELISSRRENEVRAFYSFFYRYRLKETPNLNLLHYLGYLRSTTSEDFDKVFLNHFTDNEYQFHGIYLAALLADIEGHLDVAEISNKAQEENEAQVEEEEKDFPHPLFELLIYLFTYRISWNVNELYERYHHRYPSQAAAQLKLAFSSSNEKIKFGVNTFCRRYDISL
ncbi:MAG: hypothetical protein E6Q24_07160 [Chitinophagaceae bacterium]|nr:MAG: hypothetical protein E6Q24_07160 [Chitinophagaceae bacterium]